MSASADSVVEILDRVVNHGECDDGTARRLEEAIREHYPDPDDDPRFEDLLFALALYNPGGGEDYLWDANALTAECRRVLALLASENKDERR
jgi:hypothetical protein